ncbi:MAG: sigma-70 family RNA polymerase sigma factor [Candidatus Peribacteraceae bacterium]|nr:sigma-70 family RNA polymerase sigma factor [Candidatus Peribacteraceae bacterium]
MSDKKISPEFSRLIAHIVNDLNATSDEEKALKQYIKLILVIARKYVRNNVEYEDVIVAGIIGLIESVRHFDPSRSTNFNTYAIMRIKGRMYEYCIQNMTSITVPTHVGKAKVYVERMTKLLNQEPYFFTVGLSTEEVIRIWEHSDEKQFAEKTFKALRGIKEKANKIAINSKTTYKALINLAYKSMVTELVEDEARDFTACSGSNDIEIEITTHQVTERLRENLGDKKTAILILHHQEYNNEDIAKEIFKRGLTPKRISRQAVRGLLKAAEKTAQKHVKTS